MNQIASIYLLAVSMCGLSVPLQCPNAAGGHGCVQVGENESERNETLLRGLQCLMNLQTEDGGWHSQHYGSFKQGAALTTLVLYCVSHVSEEIREPFDQQIRDAYDFLQPGLKQSGFVTNSDGSQDYPVYCTAMLLIACEKLELPLGGEIKKRMISYLLESQVAEGRGFADDHLEFGGWDVLGPDTQDGKTSGTNVSVTCYVTEALVHFEDLPKVKASMGSALNWLEKIADASEDGGFFFAPKLDSMNNKARWTDEENQLPRSYGTATSDGLRIMSHCGVETENQQFVKAQEWLVQHGGVTSVPGFGKDDTGWQSSLKFYYFSTLAKSLPLLPNDSVGTICDQLREEIGAAQATNGLWQNSAALMREDDPIIATSFAVMALGLIDRAQVK